jgi:hypothetical protein
MGQLPEPLDQNSMTILPPLPLAPWQETLTTLHMWGQVVGKIRLATAPMINHWWQATLYMTARGMTTSPLSVENRIFQIDFDFIDHILRVQTSSGATRELPLASYSVANFYNNVMEILSSLDIEVTIWPLPVEVEERIPFDQDETHAAYDPEAVNRFWRALVQIDRVMKEFRGRFCGKASPVHFFWGSFDMAAARFSGRSAPIMQHASHVAKFVMQEAYSAEVNSCGFWPGAGLGQPAFYAYHYPEPAGYADYPIHPSEAYYHPDLKEFILPYEAVRTAHDWERVLLSFFQSTYEAGANLAKWDRASLEHSFLIHPDPTDGKL